ncbi:MAG: hypothetical protein ACAI44_21410 [Candidatus Sericytochromatia bacterium]
MGMEVGNRPIQFIDAQQGPLSPRLAKKLQEAAAQPGADIILENFDNKAVRVSLQDYLKAPGNYGYANKAFLLLDTEQGQIAVDLKFLNKGALLEALEQVEAKPPQPLPEGVLSSLNAMRQQIIGPMAPSHRDWNLKQENPDVENFDKLRQKEAKWPAASLTEAISLEAFTDLLAKVETSEGTTTYAIPPSLCAEVYAQLGKDHQNWQQLKAALQAIGVPDRNLQKLYKQTVVPFMNELYNTKPDLPKVASFKDLNLDRSELFQSLWKGGTPESFADLIATTPTGTGDKSWELPPETCKRIFDQLGKSLKSWEDLEAALKEVGVSAGRIKSLYSHQVTRFVQQQRIPEDTVLFLANADPNDLSMEAEAALLKKTFGDARVIVVKRPTLQETEALVQSGRFSRVWVAGHGTAGQTLMTDSRGYVQSVANSEVSKALSSHPAVKMVMGSICFGAYGGQDASLVGQLVAKGVDAVGYEASVKDSYAMEMSQSLAQGMKAGKALGPTATQAYQAAEKKRFATGIVHLAAQPVNPAQRQRHTADVLARRFHQAAYFPDDPALQNQLQASLKNYPALQPLQNLLQALQKRDLSLAGKLIAAHPALKPVLADHSLRSQILALQKLPPLPTTPLLTKQKDDFDLPLPVSPEDWESFNASLAQQAATACLPTLIAAGQLPTFSDGVFCPSPTRQTDHALDIGHEVANHVSRALEQIDQHPNHVQIQELVAEYPGMEKVLALIGALRIEDRAGFEKILAQQPDLQPLAAGLKAEWAARGDLSPAELKSFLRTLHYQAVQFFVAQQFLAHKKSFVQASGNQNLPID